MTLSRYTKYFRFWPCIHGDIHIRKLTPRYSLLRRVDALRIVYYTESKLPESFTTGSRQGLFTAKNSPHRLLRRVVTPRIVYYAESQLKCAADRGESKLCVSFTIGSHHPRKYF